MSDHQGSPPIIIYPDTSSPIGQLNLFSPNSMIPQSVGQCDAG